MSIDRSLCPHAPVPRTRPFVPWPAAPLAAMLAALACTGGCTAAKTGSPQSGLLVIVSTNLAPSEFDAIEVDVSQEVDGGEWHTWLARKSYIPAETRLPATILIASGPSPDQDVRIRVTAFHSGAPVVLREVQTQAPTDRIAELRLVLAEVCKGQVTVSGGAPASTCPKPDESCQPDTGICGPDVVPAATLPSYARGDETLDAGSPGPHVGAYGDAGGPPDATTDATSEPPDATSEAPDATRLAPDASPPDGSVCVAGPCTQFGTVCTDAQTLATCAQDPDGCFHVASVSTCAAPQSCSGLGPNAACALGCSDSCAQAGKTACVSGALATCALGGNGCLSYAQPVACGTHQTCTGTAGAAGCACSADPVCSSVASACVGPTSLATCARDAQGCFYQSGASTCTNGACSMGACCSNACTNASTQCAPTASTSYQTCEVGGNGCTVWSTSACSGSLVCERSGGVACVDPTWAEWPMPNSQVDVAGGAPNLESYTDKGDGTIADNVTGLVWQKASSSNHSQADAITFCTNLSLAGFSDWRLPSIVEQMSLVDTGHSGPAIDTAYFPDTQSTVYWTSSSSQWTVDFNDGSSGFGAASNLLPVRCVR